LTKERNVTENLQFSTQDGKKNGQFIFATTWIGDMGGSHMCT